MLAMSLYIEEWSLSGAVPVTNLGINSSPVP